MKKKEKEKKELNDSIKFWEIFARILSVRMKIMFITEEKYMQTYLNVISRFSKWLSKSTPVLIVVGGEQSSADRTPFPASDDYGLHEIYQTAHVHTAVS